MKRILTLLLPLLSLAACGEETTPNRSDITVALTADAETGQAPLQVNFSAAVPDAGNEVGYRWDFDTGDTTQGSPSRSYTFEEPGTFEVVVVVAAEEVSASDAVTITVTAPPPETAPTPGNEAPTVSLEASTTAGKGPLEVSFSAAASDPDGDTLSYSWNFGDGRTEPAGSGDKQTHTFSESGSYVTAVTVTDGEGGNAQAELQIAVADPDPEVPPADPPVTPAPDRNEPPTVKLGATTARGNAPLTVSFNAEASDPEDDPLTYAWAFGNGERAEGNSSRTVTYTEPGTYTAVVAVSDGLATERASFEVNVRQGVEAPEPPEEPEPPVPAPPEEPEPPAPEPPEEPAPPAPEPPEEPAPPAPEPPEEPAPPANTPPKVTLSATPVEGSTPLSVSFSARASDAEGDELTYLWDFGDGTIAGGSKPKHTYREAGEYSASVTVNDGEGGTTRKEVAIDATPSAGEPEPTPDVPFYGEWAWAGRSVNGKTFKGYLSISKRSPKPDNPEFSKNFVEGGKGAWTHCAKGLDACGSPTGLGFIDVVNFGQGDGIDVIFVNKAGETTMVAFDDDDKLGNEVDGAPTLRGSGAWFYENGSSDDLSFAMVKTSGKPEIAIDTALSVLSTQRNRSR